MPDARYASLQDAAKYAAAAEVTIRRMIARGELTRYKVGRVLRVDLAELDEAMRGTRSA